MACIYFWYRLTDTVLIVVWSPPPRTHPGSLRHIGGGSVGSLVLLGVPLARPSSTAPLLIMYRALDGGSGSLRSASYAGSGDRCCYCGRPPCSNPWWGVPGGSVRSRPIDGRLPHLGFGVGMDACSVPDMRHVQRILGIGFLCAFEECPHALFVMAR